MLPVDASQIFSSSLLTFTYFVLIKALHKVRLTSKYLVVCGALLQFLRCVPYGTLKLFCVRDGESEKMPIFFRFSSNIAKSKGSGFILSYLCRYSLKMFFKSMIVFLLFTLFYLPSFPKSSGKTEVTCILVRGLLSFSVNGAHPTKGKPQYYKHLYDL